MSVDMTVDLAGLQLRNPVMPASGCFGYGREYGEYYSLDELGAVVVKATTRYPRLGNPTPRVTEVAGGMLNAIGLANPGLDEVLAEELPWLSRQNVPIFVNVAGDTVDDYCQVVDRICRSGLAQAIELNVSCPNVKLGGLAFGVDATILRELVQEVRKVCSLPLYVKLSPNVTRVQDLAIAAASGGADGLSLINTLIGMQIDLTKRKPILANKTGGLSGRSIKPVAVRMVYEVAQEVDLPIIGMGGVYSGRDAAEFIMAGAWAVEVGTANFTDPYACPRIIGELRSFMEEEGIKSLEEIRGCAL
ncbi:MAG: dihydroorotate dehydrogenase [Limnochordia bacterium]|jgi:dihydroorotate dehydrogenase (NAD+) catalytic subunit|nr:dihydroorotate dehydrogenase [Limnochordia bacterium]